MFPPKLTQNKIEKTGSGQKEDQITEIQRIKKIYISLQKHPIKTIICFVIIIIVFCISAYVTGFFTEKGKIAASDVNLNNRIKKENSKTKDVVYDQPVSQPLIEAGDTTETTHDMSEAKSIRQTENTKSNDSQKYSLLISYRKDGEKIANRFRDLLNRSCNNINVRMEMFPDNGFNKTELSIKFLYKDGTLEVVARNIYVNLDKKGIEFRHDATLVTTFKIVIH